jgi:aromatic ring-opening dioxygenase catalytic subunit (LigB family)
VRRPRQIRSRKVPNSKLGRRAFLGATAAGAAGLAAHCVTRGESSPMTQEPARTASSKRLPALYIPHGGGPCFFMDWTLGPPDTWNKMAGWLRDLGRRFAKPEALLVVSAHWEEPVATVQSGARPALYFDYYGFPAHTYELTWPAPGAPAVAARVRALLEAAGIPNREDPARGFDHGVFVPLKVAYPEARIPTLQLSIYPNMDPAAHLALGRALAPLRDEGVLIVGSGMSFHNLNAFFSRTAAALEPSRGFDGWLERAVCGDPNARGEALRAWAKAPAARYSHPREDHLLPLMVAAGAAEGEPARRIFEDVVMGAAVSAFELG